VFYTFDHREVDTQRYELRRGGVPISLGPKVFDLLVYLIQYRHRVVTKQELFEQLWPDQFVGDAALSRCISMARKAIGDPGGLQPIIKALYGRGYRFMAPVEERDASLPSQDQPPSPPAPEPTSLTPYHLDVERKHITVLACGIAASAALIERLQPENLHHLMHGIFNTAWRQVQQYEGLMHHVTDDGFVALFGVPQSHEDHAQRALLAAVHLQQQLASIR